MKQFSVKTVVAIGIGAALFFVLGRFVSIPSGIPDTNISIQYGVLAFIAAVFGPIAGFLAGIIGHFFIDFSFGWGIWWSWVIASSIFGCIMGLATMKIDIDNGEFALKEIIIFNVSQIVAHLISWVGIAPCLDILMYKEPANKVFIQGLTSAGINILATAVVGTLLCVAYAAARPKKDSLREEQ